MNRIIRLLQALCGLVLNHRILFWDEAVRGLMFRERCVVCRKTTYAVINHL